MTVVNPSAQSILVHKRPTQSFTVLCKYSQQTINLCLVPISGLATALYIINIKLYLWSIMINVKYKSKLHIKSLNRLNHNLNILSWHFSDSKMGACGHLVDYLDEDLRTSAAVKKNLSVVNWEYLSNEWFINIHDVWTVLPILVNFSFMPKVNS